MVSKSTPSPPRLIKSSQATKLVDVYIRNQWDYLSYDKSPWFPYVTGFLVVAALVRDDH